MRRSLQLLPLALLLAACAGGTHGGPSCGKMAHQEAQIASIRRDLGQGQARDSDDVIRRHWAARRAAVREAELHNARKDVGCAD